MASELIKRLSRRRRRVDFAGLDTVLYTNIGSNIENRTAENLASLAITSARAKAGEKGEDGINYLSSAISQGIVTPLTAEYRKAILARTGGRNLGEAFRLARVGAGKEGKKVDC